MMSSSPMPIRRAGPEDVLSRSSKENLLVTPSGQLYGSTPGGTRIVYSREQLLSLASSPLSKTPPHIPAEISRSPEKSTGHINQAAGQRVNGGGIGSISKPSNVFIGSPHNGFIGNGHGTASSPPAQSLRSPGNAFNFTNGPISPNSINHSTSFKERLAAAQQNSSPPGKYSKNAHPVQHLKSDASNGDQQATPTEEQFEMDM